MIEVIESDIADLKLLRAARFEDARGYMQVPFSAGFLAQFGFTHFQSNESFSPHAGTLRGLHYQCPPHAQAKLVRCPAGAVFDVSVDLRPASATFRQVYCCELSAANGLQILVPKGFAHGVMTLQPDTIVSYLVDGPYAPEAEAGLAWDDPDLAIAWPRAPCEQGLSEKDRAQPSLASYLADPHFS